MGLAIVTCLQVNARRALLSLLSKEGKMKQVRHGLMLCVLAGTALLSACNNDTQSEPAVTPPQNNDQELVTGLPDFTALVEREGPAVVNISTVTHREKQDVSERLQQIPEFFRRFFEEFGGDRGGEPMPSPPPKEARSLGSGFIISSDGYVLTNNHVVEDADEIIVRMKDRRELSAELVGADERSDLALLKVEGDDLPVVDIGSSDALSVGEWVLAIGAPFGFDSSVTAGIVSAKGRSLPSDSYVPFIQTDVAINPGNSGGPLFNLKGQVVGINSQIFSRSGGYMGVSFAIPMDLAMNVVSQLKDGGKVSRGWLGVLIQEVDRDLAESFGLKQPMGALVSQVVEGSPAEKAGLQPGDVIIEFNGESIYRSAELPKLVGRQEADSQSQMVVVRDGKRKKLDVTIGLLPDNPERSLLGQTPSNDDTSALTLGVQVRAARSAELAEHNLKAGVVVTRVDNGPAKAAGVRQGDILVALNSTQLTDPERLEQVVADLPEQGTVALLVNRDGAPRFLALRLD